MFDQRSAHYKICADGLITSNMNVLYDGQAARMSDSIIK